VQGANQLCRAETDLLKRALADGRPVTIGCMQEEPVFRGVADEMGATSPIRTIDLRIGGGWSSEARDAGPKIAALLAAAAEPAPAIQLVSFKSDGVALVYGRDETAIEVGRRLAAHLDVTVLLDRPGAVPPPRGTEFPVFKGTIVGAKGHLGGFELRIDDFALAAPSSRARLAFGPSRDGTTSRCDLVVDVSGGLPLFPAHDLRHGYLRADPRDRASVERAVFEASHLVGEFDKPRFVTYREELCAHSRSGQTGCTRCLSVCPTGAIAPAGDHVVIDPKICAGCGSCASVCPTGAASYALPPSENLLHTLRTLLLTYAKAGGRDGVVLFHDGDHGDPLIDALARFSDGLPANVLPVRVNEVSQVGIEGIAAVFAYGGTGVRMLTRAKPKHDTEALGRAVDLASVVVGALGYGVGVVSAIPVDDPDDLRAALEAGPRGQPSPRPAGFLPLGTKRGLLELTFRELHRAAPIPSQAAIPLPALAPFGRLEVDVQGCTLCLACVGACPTGALSDNPEQPMLRFTEALCVQCGLCASTCPENVISLRPQLDVPAWDAPARVVKEEEPFHCTSCAKPFGVRSTIERVTAKLQGTHWMFAGPQGEARLRVLTMCEDCRVEVLVNESFDPHAGPTRPRPRTSEDYLRERAEGLDDLA
jgi:ferredoxin